MDCIIISDDTSSSSSESSPNKTPSVVSLSTTIESHSTPKHSVTKNSDERQKCTVAPQITNNNVSPLKSRVDMWVTSTIHLNQSPTGSYNTSFECSEARSNSSHKNDYLIQKKYEELPRRNILIRHDFDKDEEVSPIIPSCKSNWICNNDNNLNGYSTTEHEECLGRNIVDTLTVENIECETYTEAKKLKQKFDSNEVPLSPETQKKNELCSYLQLMNMNCTDQKMASKIQNRRSTRVKNLIIMSEKKELERRLNNEALEKEKEFDIGCTTSPSSNDKNLLVSKSPVEFNLDLEENHEKDENEKEQTIKLLNIQNIPREILEERSDFDDAIKSLIPMERYNSDSESGEEEKIQRPLTVSPKKYKYTKKRKKYPNRNLSELSISKSRFVNPKTKLLQQSSNNYNHKMKSFHKNVPCSQRNKSQIKQDSLARNKHIKRILLRHSGRQNLRSKLSLSGVGIKTLILKDGKNKRRIKKKSSYKKSSLPKVQRNISNCTSGDSSEENKTKKELRFSIKKSTNTNKRNQNEPIEISNKHGNPMSDSNLFKAKSYPILRGKIIKINKHTNGIETERVHQKIDNMLELSEKRGGINNIKVIETKTKDFVRTKEVEKVQDLGKPSEKHMNNFKEKAFNVIDLSHSKSSASTDTLNDHNYTMKSHTDKGYIMNVILGTNQRSPTMETVENRLIGDDVYCKSPEMPSGCKDGEYCKEMLEEIIGIPWRHIPKKPSKSKEEDYSNNTNKTDYLEKCKGVMENQIASHYEPPHYEYNSYQDSLLLNSNSPNKMFNIRLPLLEPPTNIFDEGPCSPHLEHPEEVPETHTKNSTPNDDIIGKPRVITMGVPPEIKSLHKSLMHGKRRLHLRNSDLCGESSNHNWENDNSCEDRRSHSIRISPINGCVMNAFYVDFNLAVVQEQLVSFWSQSALGNMLGSQDMWVSKGSVHRLLLDSNCVYKESSDMVIRLENSFAYVELWIKEHKSDKRERPVADVFATIYFWRQRQNAPDKKVLQLENINGKGGDVQYIVLQNSRNIVVSWVETREDMKKTVVHYYCLAPDYQTVIDIREMDTVDHCVTSLHNIEDCNNMVMGYGEQNVTLWNLEYGYVVATIEIKSVSPNPGCLWIKCDRGFLFILQHHQMERLLVLIAVNGISHSWKRLQVFRAPYGYDGLRGVCIDNNVLAAFYQRGVLCWNIQTGESVIEEMSSQTSYIPCDKHIVMLNKEKVQVQQFLSYFITNFDLQ